MPGSVPNPIITTTSVTVVRILPAEGNAGGEVPQPGIGMEGVDQTIEIAPVSTQET